MSAERIRAIRKKMQSRNLDSLVVTSLDHIRYLSGFTGTSGLLLIGPKSADFLTDSRYTIQAKKQG